MTQHHPQNAPVSPLNVTLKKEKRGQKGYESQPHTDQPSKAPDRPLPTRGLAASRHLPRQRGGGPGHRSTSPPALTLAGAGVSPRRSRAVTGAAGGVRRLPTPRGRGERGGAGPCRGRLRGAGWQAGARHGFCPIQHFPILSPFSFERESPAQISEPALPRSAGTDITRPGFLTPSRARRPGRWGGQRPAQGAGTAREERSHSRALPLLETSSPPTLHPRGLPLRPGVRRTGRCWRGSPGQAPRGRLHAAPSGGSAPAPPAPGSHLVLPSRFGQKPNGDGGPPGQSSWLLEASSSGLPNRQALVLGPCRLGCPLQSSPSLKSWCFQTIPGPEAQRCFLWSSQVGSWHPQRHAALISCHSPEGLVECPRLQLEHPSLVVGSPRAWGWCQDRDENQISVMVALLTKGHHPAPHTWVISHMKWLKQTGLGLQAFLMIAASTQNILFRDRATTYWATLHAVFLYMNIYWPIWIYITHVIQTELAISLLRKAGSWEWVCPHSPVLCPLLPSAAGQSLPPLGWLSPCSIS